MTQQTQNSDKDKLSVSRFFRRDEKHLAITHLDSMLRDLGGYKSSWIMSNFDSAGMPRSFNNPLSGMTGVTVIPGWWSYSNDGILPYVSLTGGGHFADTVNPFDLPSNEAWVNSNYLGFSIYALIRVPGVPTLPMNIVSKYDTGSGVLSYRLRLAPGGTVEGWVSPDSIATFSIASLTAIPFNQWVFICFRFDPGNVLELLFNETVVSPVGGAPALCFTSALTELFRIGGNAPGNNNFEGDISFVSIFGMHHKYEQVLSIRESILPAYS